MYLVQTRRERYATHFNKYRDIYKALSLLLPSIALEPTSKAVEVDTNSKRPLYYDGFNRLSAKVITKKRQVATKEDNYTRYIEYFDPTTCQPVTDVIS